MYDIAFVFSLSMATYFKLKLQLRLATEIDLSTWVGQRLGAWDLSRILHLT